MLERAYNRSAVGRTVLYRLVEVTTALGQYDEALEYYSEYEQIAPCDNNRYVLKYLLYKGRGSAPQDLIPILEEYLKQEYTERWAYELATVYQQAGQIQKCLAACDNLVLCFPSGKYVKKALDLKKRYAMLTPKQQQIYAICLREDEHKSITASNADTVNTKEKYVFISYSSKNQRIADSVRFMLLEKGVPCWMAPYDIPAGSKYAYVINDALENCACLLLLLSNASQNSQFVEREIERAISYKKAIIPMQLEELELNSGFKFYIGNCQIISVPEIRKNSPEFDRILKGINRYL
ncbi:MAG: toll/interleukin-1 receptor domain-containing protein [Clostridiales bacterium]|nr:toll/interleukin-1 receptor domain-containing protein [Clostridiales bacterium]